MHMVCNMTRLVAVLLIVALLEIVRADDMAFVEVDEDGGMGFRFLDFNVPTKAGIAGFFEESPMFPHDWLLTHTLKVTVEAVFAGAVIRSSVIGKQVSKLEKELAPLFATLPKKSSVTTADVLADGPARYALHRHFRRTHGWSLKGLEPAGASLLLQNITGTSGDVQQVSRYVLPSFLLSIIRDSTKHKGFELCHLTIIIVVIERLVLHDLQEKLFSVFRTLQLSTDGAKSKKDIENIIDTFLLMYAFGMNLEISTRSSVEDAKAHLHGGHAAWPKLRNFISELMQASETPVVDFQSILRFLAHDFADTTYAKWLNRDCAVAKSSLAAAPQMDKGRVPLEEFPEPSADIRPLFAEQDEDLSRLGVLEDAMDDHVPIESEMPRLLASNYILSQAMCLSTASAYTICCPNECDDVMESLENKILAPSARPEEVIAALLEASPALRTAGLDAGSLRAQASDPSDGLVRLHGRAFASWLHSVLPLECPAPGSTAQLGPKTPDEWMQEPNMDQDHLVTIEVQHDSSLAAFTTMGSDLGERQEQPSDRYLEAFPVMRTYPDTDAETEELHDEGRGINFFFVRFVCMVCVFWGASASVRSGLSSMLLRVLDSKLRARLQ